MLVRALLTEPSLRCERPLATVRMTLTAVTDAAQRAVVVSPLLVEVGSRPAGVHQRRLFREMTFSMGMRVIARSPSGVFSAVMMSQFLRTLTQPTVFTR